MREITVLLYHNVGHYSEEMMEDGLLPETFEKQMAFLSENGYVIVPLEQAVAHLSGHVKLPPKSLAITIDGGYEDAFTHVLPVLRKYNFPATFFIPPGFIGKERSIKGHPIKCLTWDEIDAISRSGMEIGLLAYDGMGIRHQYDEQVLKDSVVICLNIMSNHIHGEIRYCAFKEGVPGTSLWKFLQNSGIKAVFTQCPTNQPATLSAIGRIQIDDDDHNIFLTKISSTYLFFKDKSSWKYIRRYKFDRLAHHVSEFLNRMTRFHN
ncbi:MAG: polysaccharide deacetylase family protein [Deltaproteobacteria bacterium]